MKRLIFLLFSIAFLFSCTGNTIYKKPEGLISKDSMVMIIKELYLANSAKNIRNKNSQRRISYIPLIYDKYKIDSLRFQNSNLYYTSKPDEFSSILRRAFDELVVKQKEVLSIKRQRDSITQDSINKGMERQLKLKEQPVPTKGKKLKSE